MILNNSEIQAYLKRLGLSEIERPTLPFLNRLHRAHVERLSWQTIDIVAGKPASIDPKQSIELIIGGRSGYCFHLNGAFGTLLRSLGFKVHWHWAGVQPAGMEPRLNGFHLAMSVGTINEEGDEALWIADAGLGDMPFEPIPLAAGIYKQGPFTYTVTHSELSKNGWRIEHDPLAHFVGVDVASDVLEDLSVFYPKHEHYSTSPESPWIRTFLVRHRHATGSNELRGCVWSRRDGDRVEKIELSTQSRWRDVLGDVFGERLVAYDSAGRDALWGKVHAMHEEWKRAQELAGNV
ncbi:arylamine N-acetyltransferase [Paenibacillus sp. LHD-117]|nr:arylamine N-acetyltransferase [Paenibacillus sp. LHD-117]MDQ6422911.1 arylamine N-acetyltransferase [Paenibacillus sp. LHD-117]